MREPDCYSPALLLRADQIIESRRDVRAFRSDPVPEDALRRILGAAHHAPSVGFMQPWNFIVVRDRVTKAAVKASFLEENARATAHYTGERGELYRPLKLEGIEEAPLNICVTCDRTRGGPHVLGRNTIVDTDVYSTCCAVGNLWLAARAEGIGVGWVSILTETALPEAFYDEPELERRGWRDRLPLDQVIFSERWAALDSDPEAD